MSGASDPMTDADLLARAAGGETDAFARLIERHLPRVLALGRRMLGDDAEADDVAQECMLRLWRNAGSIEVPPGGLGAWLYRVASNLSLDRIRARKPQSPDGLEELPEPASQFTALADAERAMAVDNALQALPDRQRQAVVLCHYEGLSMAEAGEIMQVSAEAIESLLARGRRALKRMLEPQWRSLLHQEGET